MNAKLQSIGARLVAALRWTAFFLGIVVLAIGLLIALPGMWLCRRFERNDYE